MNKHRPLVPILKKSIGRCGLRIWRPRNIKGQLIVYSGCKQVDFGAWYRCAIFQKKSLSSVHSVRSLKFLDAKSRSPKSGVKGRMSIFLVMLATMIVSSFVYVGYCCRVVHEELDVMWTWCCTLDKCLNLKIGCLQFQHIDMSFGLFFLTPCILSHAESLHPTLLGGICRYLHIEWREC